MLVYKFPNWKCIFLFVKVIDCNLFKTPFLRVLWIHLCARQGTGPLGELQWQSPLSSLSRRNVLRKESK